jgi:hypothetical protein
MKNVLFLRMLLIAFALVLLNSCNKNDSDEEEPKLVTSMTALVDGESWTANQAGCSVINGITGIAGTEPQGYTITMTVKNFFVGGWGFSYNYETNVAVLTDGNVTYTTNSDPATSGKLTIDEINTKDSLVSGTFEFKAYSFFKKDFIYVTEGKFSNVPFTTKLPDTPDNSLEVDIDGITFTPSSVNASLMLGMIMITASDSQVSKTVGITLDSDIEIGIYEMSSFGDVIGQYNLGTSILMSASSGTLEVTKHDKTQNILEGTFEFEAVELLGSNSASLTNGSFIVSY